MGQKKKTKAPKEDLQLEFANNDRAEAFSCSLDSDFSGCEYKVEDSLVKVWAPKALLPAICTMSENPAYARRKLVRLTQF